MGDEVMKKCVADKLAPTSNNNNNNNKQQPDGKKRKLNEEEKELDGHFRARQLYTHPCYRR